MHNNSNKVPYSDGINKILDQMLNRILSGMLFLAAFGAPASLLRIFSTGSNPVYYIHIFVAISIVILFLARNALGVLPKSILLILLLFGIGVPAFLSFGFYSAALFWFAAACLIASFVFKKSLVYLLVFLVGIFIIIVAVSFSTGLLKLQMDANDFIRQWHNWIAIFTGTMVFTVVFVWANQLYNKEITALTNDVKQANTRLQTEMLEREQAQAQLLEQQRHLAAMEERERLGCDLHDGLGQVMGYLNVQAQAVHTLLAQEQYEAAQRNLTDLSQTAQMAHQEIRAHILGMHPAETPSSDFVSLVRDYIHQFSHRHNLPVNLTIPDDFPAAPFNPAVEEQAIRILQEGLTNVRRHAQAEAVTVTFRRRDRAIDMEIVDNGRGFAPNISPPEGHFGLKIMRERAEQSGGELHLHTAPGQGVRLVATLPVGQINPADEESADLAGLRILLVDDHQMFLQGLQTLLLARGFTITGTAHSGPEAVQKTRDLLPDVVVMDLHMPGGDGLEATRLIKTEFPAIKVVILTVSADENDLFEAIKNGASGFLLKASMPISFAPNSSD
jgi:signal transduction histidine kinase